MSKVISFRLEDSRPDDVKALEILQHWQAEGYSARRIIVAALLRADGIEPAGDPSGDLVADLRQTLQEARDLVAGLRHAPAAQQVAPVESEPALNPVFVAGVKAGFKGGMKRKVE
jgi:hypothetical protein